VPRSTARGPRAMRGSTSRVARGPGITRFSGGSGGCSSRERQRRGSDPDGKTQKRRSEGLPPRQRAELSLCVLSVPPVVLRHSGARRSVDPLMPLRSNPPPREGRAGQRLPVLRPQRAPEALPGTRGVSALSIPSAVSSIFGTGCTSALE
jgi:hypothetical protein